MLATHLRVLGLEPFEVNASERFEGPGLGGGSPSGELGSGK
jgi:hypothetical protein